MEEVFEMTYNDADLFRDSDHTVPPGPAESSANREPFKKESVEIVWPTDGSYEHMQG